MIDNIIKSWELGKIILEEQCNGTLEVYQNYVDQIQQPWVCIRYNAYFLPEMEFLFVSKRMPSANVLNWINEKLESLALKDRYDNINYIVKGYSKKSYRTLEFVKTLDPDKRNYQLSILVSNKLNLSEKLEQLFRECFKSKALL
jgi:hypothetical protein